MVGTDRDILGYMKDIEEFLKSILPGDRRANCRESVTMLGHVAAISASQVMSNTEIKSVKPYLK